MTTKPRKITMTRHAAGYDTFGPLMKDGFPRFIVYRAPAVDGSDPDGLTAPATFALLDRTHADATVTLGARQFVGRVTYWNTKREIREAYSTVEAQQAAGILPPATVPTDAPVRFTDRDKAARKAAALESISGQRFTVMGDGPEHGLVWIVALAGGAGVTS